MAVVKYWWGVKIRNVTGASNIRSSALPHPISSEMCKSAFKKETTWRLTCRRTLNRPGPQGLLKKSKAKAEFINSRSFFTNYIWRHGVCRAGGY